MTPTPALRFARHVAPILAGALLASLACSYEEGIDIIEDALEELPTELVVTKTADTNDGGCTLEDCSLREAVLAANGRPGPDSIYLPAGLYLLTLSGDDNLGEVGDLDVVGSVTLHGDGWGPGGEMQTVIDGNGDDRIFEIEAGVTVEMRGLRVQNGDYASGGGITNGGILTLVDVEVTQNHADFDGGGIISGGELTLRHSFVLSNSAGRSGGGVYNYYDGVVTVESDSLIGFNSAAEYGGGVHNSVDSVLYVSSSSINGNQAASGGGISISDNSGAQLNGATISDNEATYRGGGVLNLGALDVEASLFQANQGDDGGGIAGDGGIVSDGTSVYRSRFEGNQATRGSAVFANGSLTLRESLLTANVGGSAIANLAFHYPSSCRPAGSTIENVTLSGNQNFSPTYGHLAVATACHLDFRFSTVASNGGYGIFAYSAYDAESPQLEGVLLTGQSEANCSGGVVSNGHNLDDDGSCALAGAGDLSGVAPAVGPLADHGGGTLTHDLLDGSPALDAAPGSSCPPVDQRGVGRPQGAACDIGAFEREGSLPRLGTTHTATATLAAPVAQVDQDANCRSGPGTVYPVIGFAGAGEKLPIVGRSRDRAWWVVVLGGKECWISEAVVTVSGDLGGVPVRTAPATPTRTPTATPSPTPTFVLVVTVQPLATPTPTAIP